MEYLLGICETSRPQAFRVRSIRLDLTITQTYNYSQSKLLISASHTFVVRAANTRLDKTSSPVASSPKPS
jgi:hypothetical protein